MATHTTASNAARGRLVNSFDGNHADVELWFENDPNDPNRTDAHDASLPYRVKFEFRPAAEVLIGFPSPNCTQHRGLIVLRVSGPLVDGDFRVNALGDELIALFKVQQGDTWNNGVLFRRWQKIRDIQSLQNGRFEDVISVDYEING